MKLVDFHREENLHEAICEYIRRQYPSIIFTSEPSGVRVSMHQAKKLKRLRSNSGLPDLWILTPNEHHHALLLEIKREKSSPYKKDGSLRENEHVQTQAYILEKLRGLGYWADFAVGFDNAIRQIDEYMANNSYTFYKEKFDNIKDSNI